MLGFGQKKLAFKCRCCGKIQKGSPSFGYDKPTYYFGVPENERNERITIDNDLCHILADPKDETDNDVYVIRCILDIPIHGVKEPFCWGLWVTQSKDNFQRYAESFDTDQSGTTTFAWLAVAMKEYGRTSSPPEPLEHLACDIHWGRKGKRPEIVIRETDHPLYLDQKNGISWERAVEIAQSHIRHPATPKDSL